MSERSLNQMTVSTQSVRGRINRRVAPIILMAFVAVGLVGFFGVRGHAFANQNQQQDYILEDMVRTLNARFRGHINQVAPLASNSITRTLIALPPTASTYNAVRDQMVGLFLQMMGQQGDSVLGMRLIAPDGRVQAEVVRGMEGDTIITTEQTGLGRSLFGDPWFLRAISAQNDQVIVSRMLLLSGADERPLTPLTPYFRLTLPVRYRDTADQVSAVLQMDISARQLFMDFAGYDDPGRRLLITNRNEEIVFDSHPENDGYLLNFSPNIRRVERIDQDPGEGDLINLPLFLVDNRGTLTMAEAGPYLLTSTMFEGYNAVDMPWRALVADDTRIIFNDSNLLAGVVLLVSVLVGGVVSITTGTILYRLLSPFDQASQLAQNLADRRAAAPVSVAGDDLNQSLTRIAGHLHDLSEEMEEQRQRLTRNLEMAARIGRETAMLSDLDLMLNRAIELICNEYGFYHAQVFLIDDAAVNAVLVYSRGEAGERMLAAGHKLGVGSASVIGVVTATAEPRIVNDTQAATAAGQHSFNPLLPDTRAEMALPLMIGDRVIGALDIQSTAVDAFDREELRAFQLLADQLAIAIHSARLLMESEQRVQQIDQLNRRLIRETWAGVDTRFGLERVYHYDLRHVTESLPEESAGRTVSVPIRIRGEMVGALDTVVPEGLDISPDDHALMSAVADHVGLALENARLFQETQVTLAETSLLYDLNRRLNEADQLERILAAITDTVVPDAIAAQILEFDTGSYYPDITEWLTVTADWSREERDWQEATLMGLRVRLVDYPFLANLPESQIVLISDVERDQRLDEALRVIFRSVDARAVAIIPLNVRSEWRGLIMVAFASARAFTDQEGRVFTALIDQAGVAVDNRFLLRQTESQLTQIERLYAASRAINTAHSLPDLLLAVHNSAGSLALDFALSLLEGALDEQGWPTRERLVAISEKGTVREVDYAYPLDLRPTSPMRNREPLILTASMRDLEFQPPLARDFVSSGEQYCAVFPLFSANQPVALFYILSDHLYEMSDEDREVYTALTGQISTVLQNRRLLEQTALALDESRRLYAASRAINTALDAAALYPAVTGHLAEASPQLMRLSVLLAGPDPVPDAPFMDCVHTWTRAPGGRTLLPLGAHQAREALPFVDHVQAAAGPVCFNDVQYQLTDAPALLTALQQVDTNSLLVSPLVSRQKWLGVIMCESTQTDAFDEQYIRLVQAIGDQLAIAIENYQLFADAQREARRALALAEVGQLAARIGSEFTDTLNEVFATVAQAAEYDRWLLLLTAEEHPGRLLVTSQYLQGQIFMDESAYFDIRNGEHSLVDAFRLNRMILINDPSQYPSFDGQADMEALVGKHIAAPVAVGDQTLGSLLVGRALDAPDLGEADEQLVGTLAAQVAVAVENRRLFEAAQTERETLRSILNTMPSGVLVLDAQTFVPILYNSQVEALLGRALDPDAPFSAADYDLQRTGTQAPYLDAELPIYIAAQSGHMAYIDDIVVMHANGSHTDLLMNAAPIYDARGTVTTIVAVMENISSLRGLENALQDNLRETITLYEATRALSEAEEIEDVLDTLIGNLVIYEPLDAFIVTHADDNTIQIARALRGDPGQIQFSQALLDLHQPRLIPDIQRDPLLSEADRAEISAIGAAAVASVPLHVRSRDVPAGWIITLYAGRRSFSAEEERFLVTLADSAAVALDNRRLFNSTQEALQEASVLYQANRALTNATTPAEVMVAVLEHLHHPGVNQVFMAQLSTPAWETPGAMATIAAGDFGPDVADLTDIVLTPEEFPAWKVLAMPETLVVDDITAEPLFDDMAQIGLQSLGIAALVLMPLRVPGRALGAICMGFSRPMHFTERDQRIFRAFAEQASLTLEASRLLDQTEHRARQLATSAQVSQFASSVLDLDTLLPRLVDLIREAFHYDHVQIFLMDAEDDYAELRASTGESGRQLLSVNHRLQKGSNSVIGAVTAENRPVVALDTGLAGIVHKPNPYLPHTRSELALPLSIKGKVVGALDVQSNQPNAFDEEDITVLTALAAQISVAIENARLFQQSESRANDMSLLFAVTTAAASAETLRDALNSVTNDLRDSLNALAVTIYLPVEYIDELTEERYSVMRPVALAGARSLSQLSEIAIGARDDVIGMSAANFRSLIINKIEDQPLYHPVMPAARSAVVVPLTSGSQLIGVITMESRVTFAYDQETLVLLQTMGGTLSALIQNQQLLERLQDTNEQLREMDRVKSEFLANMSHELRTPLNSIIGFSRVILKGIDGPLTEMQEQDLSTIYNSGQHLLGLINDILDQAKIAAGKMELKPDYFDVKAVVEGVRSIGIGLVKDKPINIGIDIQSGLPQVYGDEFRTRQVLLNLISNAAKFTSEGSITLAVYVLEGATRMVRIDVKDTGIGIAEKDMPLLFEAFRQVDSSLTRTAGGTGLGLPISRSLVELQGGEMLVSSRVGSGSTFSITIPTEPPTRRDKPSTGSLDEMVEASANGNDEHDTLRIPAGAVANGQNGHTSEDKRSTTNLTPVSMAKRQVLIIEDNPDRVDQFRRVIQRQGFDVFAASIPLEAEAMASGLRPTLIVLDVAFANGAGWNILKKLKERDDTFDIPVIVVTLGDVREQALEAGAFAFIQQPLVSDELVEQVMAAEQESRTERILIIDDQPESARLLKELLDEHGSYRVFSAGGGAEGVSMVARRRPDLVLLDLRMPEKDGFAVLDELRSNPETASIPVLIVTGDDTLNADEMARLADVRVMYKTDISYADFRRFIQGVEVELFGDGE